jgi:hypothetical protein
MIIPLNILFFLLLSLYIACARRLYDIANIFCSIGLVKKTSSSARDNRRKKRLYTWVGPDLDEKIRRKSPVSVDTPPIVVTRTAGAKREATSDSSDETSSSYYAANLKRMKIIMAQDLSSEIIVPYKDSPQPNVVSPSLSEPESAESIDKDHSNKLCWTPACNSTQISGSCGGTPLSSVPGSALSVHNSSIASSHGGSLSQYSDFTDVESPILLQAQVNQLTKALQDAKNREKELLKRIEMQDSQINKLIDIKRHTPTFVLNSNSPIANFLFSPFGPSSANGSRSFLRKARIGPQIVDPAGEDDILLSPVQIVKDKEKNHGSSKSIISTPCNLIATAASSLLSLTPTQIPS